MMKKVHKKYKRKYRQKGSWLNYLVWSLIGLALLPVLLAVLVATFMLVRQIPFLSTTIWYIVLGLVLYTFFHTFVYQPVGLYVMAHEFTHAAFALLFGYRVKKIKISTGGGYVEMSESNFVIDLAPYFFPLYTVILIAAFYGLDRLFDWSNFYWLFFIFVGIFLSFHFLSNWDVLKIEQPDLNSTGKIFAVIFVIISNLLVINVLMVIFFIDYINLNTIFDNFYHAGRFVYGLLES